MRRMSQTETHLVDHVIPHVQVWQWVLSLPITLSVVLAPNARLRARVVPQGSEVAEQATEAAVAGECEIETTQLRPGRIGWARLLKRVFGIEMQHTDRTAAASSGSSRPLSSGQSSRRS
jgi:hypothetical protein